MVIKVRILLATNQRRSDRALLVLMHFVIMPRLASQWHLSELAGLASSLIPLAVLRNASDLTRGYSLSAPLLLTGARGRILWDTTYLRQENSCGVVSAGPWSRLGTTLGTYERRVRALPLPLLNLLDRRSPSSVASTRTLETQSGRELR